jgi:hypothetical protein
MLPEMADLCRRIGQEQDSEKLAALCGELIKLLAEEQNAIRTSIRQRISKSIRRAILGAALGTWHEHAISISFCGQDVDGWPVGVQHV